MAGKKGAASSGPTPEDAARRYYQVTGEKSAAPRGATVKTTFAIGGACLDQFAVRQTWGDGVFNHECTAPIGRYNAVTKYWQFAPEFVKPQDFARLRRIADQRVADLRTAGALRLATAGEPVVDMYHPATHQTRAELSTILQRLPLAEFLARPAVRTAIEEKKGAPIVAVDGYTQAYPIIGEYFTHREVALINPPTAEPGTAALPPVALNALVLRVEDVRLQHPDGLPGTVRDTCDLLLAKRSADNPDVWAPNRDLELVGADVPVMVDTLQMLARAAKERPGFSVRNSAMVLGEPALNIAVVGVRAHVQPI